MGLKDPIKDVWEDLPKEVDQIWAESYTRWQLGEKLYMIGEEDKLATEVQEGHTEGSEWAGPIQEFLASRVPLNWDSLDVQAKRMYMNGSGDHSDLNTKPVDKTCIAELWTLVLGGDLKRIKPMDRKVISAIVLRTPEWQRNSTSRRYGPFGTQKGFEKVF